MSRAVRRWTRALPWITAACLLAGIVMAVYMHVYEAPVYRATYTMYVLPADENVQSNAALAKDCEILTRSPAFRREALGVPAGESYSVKVRSVTGTHVMELSVIGSDAAKASETANAVGTALLERIGSLFDVQSAREMGRAQTPVNPYWGQGTRRIGLAMLLTFSAGSLLGLCMGSDRTPLRHDAPEAAALAIGAVGNLRRAQREYLKKGPVSQARGTFLDFVDRWMREDIRKAVLALRASGQPARSIVLTAVASEEAEGAFSVLLAQELSRQGFRVLLMETRADDSPLRDLLGVRARADLLDYHDGRAQWTETVVSTELPTLSFVDWLHPGHSVAEVAATEWFETFLRSAEAHFDFVLLHAAPVENAADAATLGLAADTVILTARDDAYTLEELEAAAASIARFGKPVKGVVFTQMDS